MGKLDQDEAWHRREVRGEIVTMAKNLWAYRMSPTEMHAAIRESVQWANDQQVATIAANRLIDCLMLEDA